MGVNLKDARVEVEKIIGRGSGFVAVEIPFTPRAKRVLELSLEEARQLGAPRRPDPRRPAHAALPSIARPPASPAPPASLASCAPRRPSHQGACL